jgi:hypothetical protein
VDKIVKRLLLSLILFLCPVIAFGATGDITALRIVGATTGITDATSACNVSGACSGWVLEADVTSLATGGTYALGMGTNNNPSTAKISCTSTSLGYDTSGNATTISRTIYGTHQLRRIYNAGYTPPYPNDETLVSSTLTLRIALSDFVYASDTNVTCTVGAGIYNDGTHSSNIATGLVATNSSTLAYPKVIANWSWPGWTRINSSLDGDGTNHSDGSFTVRAVGFQRHAMNGKPLAAMVFTATDGTHTVSTTINDMTIDSTMADPSKVQEYVGTFSASQVNQLNQGAQITVNFKAYPWVGDSNAVMDTSDGVNSQPTPLYAPIYFVNDRLGTYGTAATVVDSASGNDGTCAAIAESAFNPSSPPAACATINKAASLMQAYNNTNYSRANDPAGTIYLKAGNHSWTGASTVITGTNNKVWITVTKFPGLSKTDVIINDQTGKADMGTASRVRVKDVQITGNPASTYHFYNFPYFWCDGCDMLSTDSHTIYQQTVQYFTKCTVNGWVQGFKPYGSGAPALIRGCDLTGLAGASNNVFTVIGNITTTVGNVLNFGNELNTVVNNYPIFAYNKIMGHGTSATPSSALSIAGTLNTTLGAAIIQNVIENVGTYLGNPLVRIAADGSTNTPVNNVIRWHNTIVGDRYNAGYNDTGSSPAIRTLWSTRNDYTDKSAVKSDTFPTANVGRVGNWAVLYNVGSMGRVDGETLVNTTSINEFDGIYSVPNPGTGQPLSVSSLRSIMYPAFKSRQTYNGSTSGAGNGDYHLTSTSPLLNMVPAGEAVLPYDLDGIARRNDGTGAAGAYEFPLPSVSGGKGFGGFVGYTSGSGYTSNGGY